MDKKEFRNTFYIIISIVSIISIFIIFCFIVIFPIYYFSKFYTKLYTIIAGAILALIILFLFGIKLFKIWKKYNKVKYFLLHVLSYFILPAVLTVIILYSEALVLQIFMDLYNFIIAFLTVNIINVFIIIFAVKISGRIKAFLKNHEIIR
jgi:amino acid transporter